MGLLFLRSLFAGEKTRNGIIRIPEEKLWIREEEKARPIRNLTDRIAAECADLS